MPDKKLPGSNLNISAILREARELQVRLDTSRTYEKQAYGEFFAAVRGSEHPSDLKDLAEAYLDSMDARRLSQTLIDDKMMELAVDGLHASRKSFVAGKYYRLRWKYEDNWTVVYVSEDAEGNGYLNYVGVPTPLAVSNMDLNDYEYMEVHMPIT